MPRETLRDTLEERVEKLEKRLRAAESSVSEILANELHLVKSLSFTTAQTRLAYGNNHVTWEAKGFESGKTEIKLPAGFTEPQAILLTPVGTGAVFRVFEGGPYASKFNVIAKSAVEEAINTQAFFFWLAIGAS